MLFFFVSQKVKLFIQHPVALKNNNILTIFLIINLSCITLHTVRGSYLFVSLFISTSFCNMALLVLSYKKVIALFCFHKLMGHMNCFVCHWVNDFLSVCLFVYAPMLSLILQGKFRHDMDAEF